MTIDEKAPDEIWARYTLEDGFIAVDDEEFTGWTKYIRADLAPSQAPSQASALDHNEMMKTLVRDYGGYSVTIVRDGQRLVGWHPGSIAIAIADLVALVEAPQPAPICDVLETKHSSGFSDFFTRVRVGERSLTTYMSKIKGRCEYHAADLDWLLNGKPKPNILDFDDTAPEGLAEYEASIAPQPAPSVREGDTAIMEALVRDHGGHSVTIVRDGQRLVGWNPSGRTGAGIAMLGLALPFLPAESPDQSSIAPSSFGSPSDRWIIWLGKWSAKRG